MAPSVSLLGAVFIRWRGVGSVVDNNNNNNESDDSALPNSIFIPLLLMAGWMIADEQRCTFAHNWCYLVHLTNTLKTENNGAHSPHAVKNENLLEFSVCKSGLVRHVFQAVRWCPRCNNTHFCWFTPTETFPVNHATILNLKYKGNDIFNGKTGWTER